MFRHTLKPVQPMPIQRVRIAVRIGAGLLGILTSASCLGAGSIVLYDYGLNRDGGITSDPSPLPSASGFNTSTGLGSFELTFTDPGSHSVLFFVDHEMSEGPNSTFNELGGVSAVNPPEGETTPGNGEAAATPPTDPVLLRLMQRRQEMNQ